MMGHESYVAIINRLKEYRKQNGLSQDEMGNKLGVTQSHYCKLENGTAIISKNSLLKLLESGQDVFWLFSGKKSFDRFLDKFINECETVKGKQQMLDTLLLAIEVGVQISDLKVDYVLRKARQLLKIGGLYENLIWEKIRVVERMTQNQMAEILDINIKRYRNIEKELIEEDAEILATLYSVLNYSPMLFLDREKYCLDEINVVWEMFDETLQNELLIFIEAGFNLIKCAGL